MSGVDVAHSTPLSIDRLLASPVFRRGFFLTDAGARSDLVVPGLPQDPLVPGSRRRSVSHRPLWVGCGVESISEGQQICQRDSPIDRTDRRTGYH